MGSPISNTIAEIYLQFFEELFIKHWMEGGDILYCKRYVDDILIIFDQNKINENSVMNHMNDIHKHLAFKITEEENNNINYLELSIPRHNNNLRLGIYRKPAQTDVTIHFTSSHPFEQKLAAFIFYVNRMLTLPITEQAKQQEWNTIFIIATNNRFPLHIIHNLRNKLITKTQQILTTQTHQKTKWITFTYHSPLIHRITTGNLFKHTNLNIAFCAANTIYKQLSNKTTLNRLNSGGIYKLKCSTCNNLYVGQTGNLIGIRLKEHTRYIKTNNPVSAYALHILTTNMNMGIQKKTLKLLKSCNKGTKMNC